MFPKRTYWQCLLPEVAFATLFNPVSHRLLAWPFLSWLCVQWACGTQLLTALSVFDKLQGIIDEVVFVQSLWNGSTMQKIWRQVFNCVGNSYGALSEIESDQHAGSSSADFQILELQWVQWKNQHIYFFPTLCLVLFGMCLLHTLRTVGILTEETAWNKVIWKSHQTRGGF